MAAEDRDDARTAGRAAESPDPLEDRMKRLAGAVLLDALPSRDPCLCERMLLRRDERLEQGRLADPHLAGNHAQLSVSRQGPAPDGLQRGELLPAPDEGGPR